VKRPSFISDVEDMKSKMSKTREIIESRNSSMDFQRLDVPLYYFDIENTNKVFKLGISKYILSKHSILNRKRKATEVKF